MTISCIFRRFQCENTSDCSEIPRTGGVRGGRDGETSHVLVSNLWVDEHMNGKIVGTTHHRRWIATVICLAIGLTLLCWSYLSKSRPKEPTDSAAEDEVYEAVVQDMVMSKQGESSRSPLVFADSVLSGLSPGTDIESCKENIRKQGHIERSTPPYNSWVDKIYRAFADGWDDGRLRADTIQDFVDKSCTEGRLSTTFHTESPRTFIAAGSVHFKNWPVETNGPPSFEELFPVVPGIIALSHVGFDSTRHEAIVSTSFVCGGLRGTGRLYILKKMGGRWKIVDKGIVWVS